MSGVVVWRLVRRGLGRLSGDWSGKVVWRLVRGSGLEDWSREVVWRRVGGKGLETAQGMVWRLVGQGCLKARPRNWPGDWWREVVLASRKNQKPEPSAEKKQIVFLAAPAP